MFQGSDLVPISLCKWPLAEAVNRNEEAISDIASIWHSDGLSYIPVVADHGGLDALFGYSKFTPA